MKFSIIGGGVQYAYGYERRLRRRQQQATWVGPHRVQVFRGQAMLEEQEVNLEDEVGSVVTQILRDRPEVSEVRILRPTSPTPLNLVASCGEEEHLEAA